MIIGTPKELLDGENRVAMTPESAVRLQKMGYRCLIETGAGTRAGFTDSDYKAVGVDVIQSAEQLWDVSDVVAKVRKPIDVELNYQKKEKQFVSFFSEAGHEEAIDRCKPIDATSIALEMVVRIIGRDPVLRFL